MEKKLFIFIDRAEMLVAKDKLVEQIKQSDEEVKWDDFSVYTKDITYVFETVAPQITLKNQLEDFTEVSARKLIDFLESVVFTLKGFDREYSSRQKEASPEPKNATQETDEPKDDKTGGQDGKKPKE